MNAVTCAAVSEIGRARSQNDDRWFADPEQGLFLVTDGMGNTSAGGLAARIVAATLPPLLRREMQGITDLADPLAAERLTSGLGRLSDQLRGQAMGKPGLEGLGATIVLTLIRQQRALIGHMGDSRAYLWRTGSLQQLTHDHSLVQLLLDCGEITPDEIARHPGRSQLTRFVGMAHPVLPEVSLVDLRSADRLLLSSDGLTDMPGRPTSPLNLVQTVEQAAIGRAGRGPEHPRQGPSYLRRRTPAFYRP
jgi:protein phosphatase